MGRPKIFWSENRENLDRLSRISGSPRIPGSHNSDNIRIAAQILFDLGLPETLPHLWTFPGLPHRLENLGERKGIQFFNDSKATSISSVQRAFETLLSKAADSQKGRLFCLVGGRDKKLPWQDLSVNKSDKRLAFCFFGECAELAKESSGLPGPVSRSLREALDLLKPELRAGDTVLLSPGGTSLDEFKNFEERGEFFKKRVTELFGNG